MKKEVTDYDAPPIMEKCQSPIRWVILVLGE